MTTDEWLTVGLVSTVGLTSTDCREVLMSLITAQGQTIQLRLKHRDQLWRNLSILLYFKAILNKFSMLLLMIISCSNIKDEHFKMTVEVCSKCQYFWSYSWKTNFWPFIYIFQRAVTHSNFFRLTRFFSTGSGHSN